MPQKYSVLESQELFSILKTIQQGKTTIEQIAKAKGTTDNTVSDQLKPLRDAGLIVSKSRINPLTKKEDKRFKHFTVEFFGLAMQYFTWLHGMGGHSEKYRQILLYTRNQKSFLKFPKLELKAHASGFKKYVQFVFSNPTVQNKSTNLEQFFFAVSIYLLLEPLSQVFKNEIRATFKKIYKFKSTKELKTQR